MSQELHLNVLDPQYARYIELGRELEDYLVEIYGPGIDFRVSVSDRCQRVWINSRSTNATGGSSTARTNWTRSVFRPK